MSAANLRRGSSLLALILDVSSATPYARAFLTFPGRCLPPVGSPDSRDCFQPSPGRVTLFFLDASLSRAVCSCAYVCVFVSVVLTGPVLKMWMMYASIN